MATHIPSPPPKSRTPTLKVALTTIFILGGFVTLAVVLTITAKPTTPTGKAETNATSHPAAINARPQIAPPKYRITHQPGDDPIDPITFVVPVGTTDAELKSLLWNIRDQIRSHSYKELGLDEPSESSRQYLSGWIEIFRGPKCAPEAYISKVSAPCGKGEHDAGYYQWGINDNQYNDEAAIFAPDRTSIPVFDGSDGYQLPAKLKAKLDAESQAAVAEAEAKKSEQQLLASTMEKSLQQAGYDINIVAGNEGQLIIVSHVFGDDFGRAAFLSDALPQLKMGLCKVGFTSVTLQSGLLSFGKSYQIGC